MDKMIDHITEMMSPNVLTPEQIDATGAYLMGKSGLEAVMTALPPFSKRNFKHYYFYNVYFDYISLACSKDPALMERLGHYLRLLRRLDEITYFYALSRMESRVKKRELFLDSGLGPEALLEYLCSKHCSTAVTEELLAELYNDYPEEMEQALIRAESIDGLCVLAYWCVRKGLDPLTQETKAGLLGALLGKSKSVDEQLSQKLLGDLIYAFAVVVYRWGTDAHKRFVQRLEKICPAVVPAMKDAKRWYQGNHADGRPAMLLFRALRVAGGKLAVMNQMARAASEAAPRQFTWALLPVLEGGGETYMHQGRMQAVSHAKAEADAQQLEEIRLKTDQLMALSEIMGLSKSYLAVFLLYQQAYYPAFWNGMVETYCSDKAVLAEALGFTGPLETLCVMRRLAELGEPFDGEKGEALFRQVYDSVTSRCAAKEALQVRRYLEGQPDAQLESLPQLGKHYGNSNYSSVVIDPKNDLEVGALLLAGDSPIPAKLFSYLCYVGHYSYARIYIPHLLQKRKMTEAAVFDFLLAAAGPATFPFLGSEDVRPFSGKLARCLIKAGLENHAQEVAACIQDKGTQVDVKVTLLSDLYEFQPDYNPDFLLALLGDKSKKVRQLAVSLLTPQKELKDKIEPLLGAKKKDVREAALTLLQAYEGDFADNENAADILTYCTKNMPKNGMAAIRWALTGDLPRVRYADAEEEASSVVVQCYLCLLLGAKSLEVPQAASRIREVLNADDLRSAARDIYDNWIAGGAPAKHKTVLLLYGLHGDDTDVAVLAKQIDQWAQSSRGAIAAEAVRAMVLSNRDMALMTVDSMSRKFKNKQVKNAAGEAFKAAAEQLGTTAEALGDRIIPTLGFDSRGELTIDYGSRTFTAALSPELTITLRDQNGKILKSLPKPGVNDVSEIAEKAKAEFTALKKSLKTVVSTQSVRLEQALALGRRWDKAAWQKLYVENPIMHCFAIGLVWGVYEEGVLMKTFRYMEDGTFTDEQEDEFALEEVNGLIGLCHPLELGEDLLSAWKEQLSDYEVKQPINQLDRTVCLMEEEEKQALTFDRFGGKKLLGITLLGRLQKLGWYKGSVQDAGFFYNFYKEIGEIGVQINFSGMNVVPDTDEEITVGEGVFYKAGTVKRGSYIYDDVDKNKVIPLREIAAQLFSETVLELTQATASASEPDPGWRSDRTLLIFRK